MRAGQGELPAGLAVAGDQVTDGGIPTYLMKYRGACAFPLVSLGVLVDPRGSSSTLWSWLDCDVS